MSPVLGRSTIARSAFFCLALLAAACGDFDPQGVTDGELEFDQLGEALTTAARHSLVITQTAVVDDTARTFESCNSQPGYVDNKEWSLPYLLKKEAARYGIAPQTYVANWLNAWNSSSPLVNGQTSKVKGAPRVIAEWPTSGGQYQIEKAPFRLTAIVFRPDLRVFRPENEPKGGEVRFVYTATETTLCPKSESEQTIILEYSPGKNHENDVLDWAKRWYALGNLSPTSSSYRNALQDLTEETIQFGKLERLRTNEVAVTETVSPGWFMHEFVPSAGGSLVRATVKQTPRDALSPSGNTNLANFIADNVANLQTVFEVPQKGYMYNAGSGYHVTDRFPGTTSAFRGAFANVSKVLSGNTYWNAPKPSTIGSYTWSLARHRFSLGTCNGCHGGEGLGLAQPFHIKPRGAGFEAQLSSFLGGPTTVVDPVDGTVRSYDEMKRRQEDLHWFANELPLGNPVYGNFYKMRFQHSGKCMDLEGNGTASNLPVKQYDCHGWGNQRLDWIDRGNNYFSLRFQHSNKCLDVLNASTSNGAQVIQRTCSSTRNSQQFTWLASSATNSPLTLTFKHSNKCLRVDNQSTANGASVIQDTCSHTAERGLFLIE